MVTEGRFAGQSLEKSGYFFVDIRKAEYEYNKMQNTMKMKKVHLFMNTRK